MNGKTQGTRKIFRYLAAAVLAAAVILMQMLPLHASAASVQIDPKHAGSISVTLTDTNNRPVGGGELSIYKVAEVKSNAGNAYYEYTSEWKAADTDGSLQNKINLRGNIDLSSETTAETFADFQKQHSLSALNTKTVGSDGKVTFSEDSSGNALTPGIYLIRQTVNADGYYAVEPFVVTIPTSITDANGNISGYQYDVDASPKVEPVNPQPNPQPEPEPGKATVNPQVTKKITGDKPGTITTFQFTLTRENSADPMPDNSNTEGSTTTVIIDGEGSTEFGTITFTKAGTYTYVIKEIAGNSQGYTYDSSEYRIVYTVDSDFHVTRTVYKDGVQQGGDGSSVIFTNKYEKKEKPDNPANPIKSDPSVTKVISGDKPDKAVDFEFTLTAEKDSYPMPKSASSGKAHVTITGQGTVEFGEITFTEPGTYAYEVREEKGSEKGYTYDESVYWIIYEVTKAENGDLQLKKNVYDSEKENIVWKNSENATFINKYEKTDNPDNPNGPVTPGGGGSSSHTVTKLPQTGQLWWPVFILFAAGAAFLLIGGVRKASGRRRYAHRS